MSSSILKTNKFRVYSFEHYLDNYAKTVSIMPIKEFVENSLQLVYGQNFKNLACMLYNAMMDAQGNHIFNKRTQEFMTNIKEIAMCVELPPKPLAGSFVIHLRYGYNPTIWKREDVEIAYKVLDLPISYSVFLTSDILPTQCNINDHIFKSYSKKLQNWFLTAARVKIAINETIKIIEDATRDNLNALKKRHRVLWPAEEFNKYEEDNFDLRHYVLATIVPTMAEALMVKREIISKKEIISIIGLKAYRKVQDTMEAAIIAGNSEEKREAGFYMV